MKRALVAVVLCLMLLTVSAPLALAADPDFWGVDNSRQNITTLDLWAVDGDGVSDGNMRFGDWYMQVLYFFGKHFRWHW